MLQIDQLEEPLICEINLGTLKKANLKKVKKAVTESKAQDISIFIGKPSKKKTAFVKDFAGSFEKNNLAVTTEYQKNAIMEIDKLGFSSIRVIFNKKNTQSIRKLIPGNMKARIIPVVDLALFSSRPSILGTFKKSGFSAINVISNPNQRITRKKYCDTLKSLVNMAKKQKISLISDLPLVAIIDKEFAGICPAGKLSFCIDSRARVSACRYSKRKIAANKKFRAIWGMLAEPTAVCQDCQLCRFFEFCGGGCLIRRTNKTKDKKCWI